MCFWFRQPTWSNTTVVLEFIPLFSCLVFVASLAFGLLKRDEEHFLAISNDLSDQYKNNSTQQIHEL